MFADKDLSPLPGLLKRNILSGGLHPRLLSFRPSGAQTAHSATEFRDRNQLVRTDSVPMSVARGPSPI